MSSGRAYGKNREYQAFCRDLLRQSAPSLTPVGKDGLDVPMALGGTTWAFDIALEVPGERLLVAECRRRKGPVKQEDVAAFAYKLCLLRKERAVPVAGVFLAKSWQQIGAVRAAQQADIAMAIVGDDNTIGSGFAVQYHRVDPVSGKRAQDVTIHVTPAVATGFALPPSVRGTSS